MSVQQREKSPASIDEVRGFWNDNVCGEHFINPSVERQTLEFFEAYKRFRYSKEHHLNELIDWSSAAGKSVLEIGLGLGADSTRWAEFARDFHGIDLTQMAVDSTKRHLELCGLDGTITCGNAEQLPYDDDRFDIVYSHGVLHHTPDTLASLREVYRVLRPGGQMIVMFYTKNSFNYWVRIQGWMRLQLLVNHFKRMIGGSAGEPWATHLHRISERGWSHFGWSQWPHHCTDGPACEIAFIRTWRQMRNIIEEAGFTVQRAAKAHFPVGAPRSIERALSRRIGFYQFIWAAK